MKENLLPALSTDDYDALKASIARDGLKQPIVLDEETGDVVDGEHRQRACRELQIEPQYVKVRFASEHEKNRYALVVNLARRHLTREQKKELIANLRKSGWTQAEVADVLGVTQKTISNQEQNGSNSKITITSIHAPDGQENTEDADNGNGDAQVFDTCAEKFSAPDLRYKLTPKMRENIVARLDKGETQEQVAADYGVSRRRVGQIAQKKQKQQSRVESNCIETNSDGKILLGDMRQLGQDVQDDSVDLIFTDPPYGKKHIDDYEELAKLASRVLKPGASLICYTGHSVLPEVLEVMKKHLTYFWIIGVKHSGPNQRFPGKWVFIEWKPLLWFTKGRRRDETFVADWVMSKPDKNYHQWGQGAEEALYYIEHLTQPGELVLDPFCGGGTTCVAATHLNRRYLAFEIAPETMEMANARKGLCVTKTFQGG
jgi:ParB-like chromosome segregation protein Spo0J